MIDSQKKHILVVEDESHLAEGLRLNLTLKGYYVTVVSDGRTALRKWKELRPDLIVLDIMLPGIDGLSILRNIRLEDERIPVLILSAKCDPPDKIKGFSYGVDDYISKPFNLDEFLLRVERQLTRGAWTLEGRDPYGNSLSSVPRIYRFGTAMIDFQTMKADGPSGKITLTELESRLLRLFIANRGRPLSRRKLLEIGWGYAKGTSTRTVDNFIVRFRKYFENNPKKPIHFKSLRSVGYVFDHDPGYYG